jgi:hypothetical protein
MRDDELDSDSLQRWRPVCLGCCVVCALLVAWGVWFWWWWWARWNE